MENQGTYAGNQVHYNQNAQENEGSVTPTAQTQTQTKSYRQDNIGDKGGREKQNTRNKKVSTGKIGM